MREKLNSMRHSRVDLICFNLSVDDILIFSSRVNLRIFDVCRQQVFQFYYDFMSAFVLLFSELMIGRIVLLGAITLWELILLSVI